MNRDGGDQMSLVPTVSPCHGVACLGGPALVWCAQCGRSFQADDSRLAVIESDIIWERARGTIAIGQRVWAAGSTSMALPERWADELVGSARTVSPEPVSGRTLYPARRDSRPRGSASSRPAGVVPPADRPEG